MEQYLVLIDPNREYSEALFAYLRENREIPFRTVLATSVAEVEEYLKSGAVRLVLAAEEYEKELLCRVGAGDFHIMWLSEKKTAKRDNIIYRYQSAKRIVKRLCGMCEKSSAVPLFALFSPAGGVWQERLGQLISEQFSRMGRVLYLSLLPFGTTEQDNDTMSELLFYARQGEEALKDYLGRCSYGTENPTVFGSVRWSADLQRITAEDIDRILRCAEEQTEFDAVVVVVGSFDIPGLTVMRSACALFVPVEPSAEGTALQAEFLRQLRESGENGILRNMVELSARHFEDTAGLLCAAAEAFRRGGELLGGHQGSASVLDLKEAESFG